MNEVMVKNKVSGTKHHWIVLVILLVISVGLLISILIISNKTSDVAEQSSGSGWGCAIKNTSSEVNRCIEENFQKDGDIDQLELEYRNAIDNSASSGNLDLAAKFILQRTALLIIFENCEDASRLLREEDYSHYEKKYLTKIYSTAMDTSTECGNNEDAIFWETKLREIKGDDDGSQKF